MSELHWMRWRAFPGISFSFSIPGNEWTTLNEMESISRYIILIFYTWKWVNYTEWDGEHFQVYHNSFSIPGNEWTTLNEMESISRYIQFIFYIWKWVTCTEWDGKHFQVYLTHFLYLEMSELHWMRWRAFPGISFSFSIPGKMEWLTFTEWTTLMDGEHFQVYQLIFYTWKWVNYTEWDGQAFPGISFSFSIPGNEWTTLNEMESISRYIILIFYTWKWVNYTEWDGKHFQVYPTHFLYLEMSELHWMRWSAFPGISNSFSIPGNEWTTLNEMESISRYIQFIFYIWKWVTCTEWDGKHFQVYLTHILYLEMSELHWMRWRAFPGISFSFSIPGNEWTTLNEMDSISRYIILISYSWKWVNYTEWDGQHFQVCHSHFLYLEMSELHWMIGEAFPGISSLFSIPGNKWTALNDMGSISKYIFLIFYTWNWVNYTEWDGKHFQVYHSHFLYLEMSELHWMRWKAFPGISFSFSIPGNEWTTLNEMESISRYIFLNFNTWKWVNYTEWDGEHFQVYHSHFLYLEMSELHWMRWRAFPGISFSFSIPGNEWTTLNEMESISRYIQLIFKIWKWVTCTEWDGKHFQVYLTHFLYLEISELHWMRWRAFPGISFSFSIPGNEWTALNEMESISSYI